jgi:DNA end-binding protein Ku
MRSSWEGYLRLSLISVPVKAFSASVSGRGKIAFHQIHAKCNSRIRYQKVCPIHGEVSNDEIVPGYEITKDEYVILDPKELAELRRGGDKSINIDVFIHPEAIDPMYYTDRSYYLTPDGKVGDKPYAVLHQVMSEENRQGVGTMLLAGRENIVLLRPIDGLLFITLLSYEEQMKKPSAFKDEVPDVKLSADEVRLAKTLVEETTSEEFDFGRYKDEYTGKVAEMIEAKAKGKKIVAPPAHDEPVIVNLMDALKKSLNQTRHPGKERETEPAKRHKVRHGGRRKTA